LALHALAHLRADANSIATASSGSALRDKPELLAFV
jgi:hypothetical protein